MELIDMPLGMPNTSFVKNTFLMGDSTMILPAFSNSGIFRSPEQIQMELDFQEACKKQKQKG